MTNQRIDPTQTRPQKSRPRFNPFGAPENYKPVDIHILQARKTNHLKQKNLHHSTGSVWKKAWIDTYPRTGYDPVYGLGHDQERISSLPIVSSFLGLPNRPSKNGDKPLFNILKQMAFAPDRDLSFDEKVVFGIFGFFWTLLIRLPFQIIPNLALNLIKLPTEFLLTGLRNMCLRKVLYAESKTAMNIATVGYIVCASLLFLVRSITSFVKNARIAWKFGLDVGKDSKTGKLLPIVFTGISLACTVLGGSFALMKILAIQSLPHAFGLVEKVASAIIHKSPVFGAWMKGLGASAMESFGVAGSAETAGLVVMSMPLFVVGSSIFSRVANRISNAIGIKRISAPQKSSKGPILIIRNANNHDSENSAKRMSEEDKIKFDQARLERHKALLKTKEEPQERENNTRNANSNVHIDVPSDNQEKSKNSAPITGGRTSQIFSGMGGIVPPAQEENVPYDPSAPTKLLTVDYVNSKMKSKEKKDPQKNENPPVKKHSGIANSSTHTGYTKIGGPRKGM